MFDIDKNFELGRSGCKFVLNEKELILQKFSKEREYNERLFKQFEKQKNFSDILKFSKPIVYEFNTSENLWNFNMQYIRGNTFSQYCNNENVNSILEFSDQIVKYLKFNFDNSLCTDINFTKLENKLIDLKIKLLDLDLYFKYLLSNPIEKLNIGNCHGDFTLSNIIFSDKYYLIDFLDNIYETPLNDLIKIKQDTEHNFYFNLIKQKNNKIKICFDYINESLNKTFEEIINTEHFIWFSIFNLLRILPYLKEKNEIDSILKILKKYEYRITSSR
jgi:hypothetical protein